MTGAEAWKKTRFAIFSARAVYAESLQARHVTGKSGADFTRQKSSSGMKETERSTYAGQKGFARNANTTKAHAANMGRGFECLESRPPASNAHAVRNAQTARLNAGKRVENTSSMKPRKPQSGRRRSAAGAER